MKDIIIITGCSGRIGSALIQRLGEKYQVLGFDLLKVIRPSERAEMIPVDLTSDESVDVAFMYIKKVYGNRIASVIHLAAYYSFATKESKLYDIITVKGTERLLKQLQGFEVEQLVFTSTMLVHAPTKLGKPINEDASLTTAWGYPRSKVVTEKLIHEQRGRIPVVVLRVAGVYDDQCHSIPLSNQIQRIYERELDAHFYPADKRHGASYIHMDDLVDAITLAVDKRKELPPESTMLIGEPKTLSYDELQNEMSQLLFGRRYKTYRIPKVIAKLGSAAQCMLYKQKPFIRPWMIDFANDHYELDISRAKALLGWFPQHSLKETLPKMIETLKKDQDSWYKINLLK